MFITSAWRFSAEHRRRELPRHAVARRRPAAAKPSPSTRKSGAVIGGLRVLVFQPNTSAGLYRSSRRHLGRSGIRDGHPRRAARNQAPTALGDECPVSKARCWAKASCERAVVFAISTNATGAYHRPASGGIRSPQDEDRRLHQAIEQQFLLNITNEGYSPRGNLRAQAYCVVMIRFW